MKFALNYSTPAAKLLLQKKITLDLFKCTDWDDMVASALALLPSYVHFPLNVGQGDIGDLDRAADFAKRTGTSLFNTHCRPGIAGDPFQDVIRDLNLVSARFGADCVTTENLPYPMGSHPWAVEGIMPEFLHRVLCATGCGLLLDLAHARMAAEGLGLDPFKYISQLPVTQLRELHVVGVGRDPAGLPLDHSPMSDLDWGLFDWALSEISSGQWRTPEIVSCEYGGEGEIFRKRSDPLVIESQIPRMYHAVRDTREKMGLMPDGTEAAER